MKNKIILFTFMIILNILTFGCTNPPNITPPITETPPVPDNVETKGVIETISLFFGSAENDKIVIEEREINFNTVDDKFKVILDELILGPKDETLQKNIPEKTIVYGTIRQNDDIIINLNGEFLGFSGSMAETLSVGSIVNTLTQFDDITRVKILIEGEELIGPSGEPRGFMEEFPLGA